MTKNALEEYLITDPSHVCGILPVIRRNEGETDYIIAFETHYEKIVKPKMTKLLNKELKGEVIEIEGTKYSEEYILNMVKTAEPLFGKSFEVFTAWDKVTKKVIPNKPVILKFGTNLCMILAPRVSD